MLVPPMRIMEKGSERGILLPLTSYLLPLKVENVKHAKLEY